MTNRELFDILQPIIVQLTGVNTILSDQNEKAPPGPYATIRPRQSVRQRGQANITAMASGVGGEDVTTTIKRQIVATCSIQFYRGEARANAELVKEINKLPSVQVALYRAGLGWGGSGPVNDLTGLQSANWEQRAAIDVNLMYETTSVDTVNSILSASVAFENEDAEPLQTVNITP